MSGPGPSSHALPDLHGMRVLLVDDVKDARDMIEEVLRQCGANVIAVAAAQEAIESLQAIRPDVLITDISMPHGDGYALIHAVRALRPEEGGQTPAVAMTAYATETDRARLLAAGFQLHLAKPIDPLELPSQLAKLVGAIKE
jgi:CheY-like chemotaxis protein